MFPIKVTIMVGRRVLVFDVETTGLIPKQQKFMPPPPLTDYPHILQFSFAIYDLYDRLLVRTFDSYINVDPGIQISPFVSQLTGIDRTMCDGGRDIISVLDRFYEAYVGCNVIVAHNMDFDEKMIMIEIERNRAEILRRAPYLFTLFNTMYEKINGVDRYCTMKRGTTICNLEMPQPECTLESQVAKKPYQQKKWPKLTELYPVLFPGEVLENAHNSIVDVLGCLRCYLKMRHHLEPGPTIMRRA